MTAALTANTSGLSDAKLLTTNTGPAVGPVNSAAAGETTFMDEEKENDIVLQFMDAIRKYWDENRVFLDKMMDAIELNDNQDANFDALKQLTHMCDSLAAEFKLSSRFNGDQHQSVIRIHKRKVLVGVAAAASSRSQSASELKAVKTILMQFATRIE